MKNGMIVLMVCVLAAMVTGCATGPATALSPKALKGDNVVYFEQSDRVPKAVLLEAYKSAIASNSPMVTTQSDMLGDIVDKVIEELISVAPKMADVYSNERMHNVLIGRRMLFKGYESPEQLKELNEIIKNMNGAIENLTPQE